VNPHSVPPEAAAMLVAAASTLGKMANVPAHCKYLVNKKQKIHQNAIKNG
jgi:hypothetical protein